MGGPYSCERGAAGDCRKLSARQPAKRSIYLQSEISFTGTDRPAMFLDRDGAEKLVREAAERHKVDPRWCAL